MTLNMAVGMVAWMRLRGHAWRTTAEMTLAMCAATTVALGMFWLHIIAADPMIALMHVLMLPAMFVAMLRRREEYAHAHR
jgi:flagellar biosynthetic protein FliP